MRGFRCSKKWRKNRIKIRVNLVILVFSPYFSQDFR
nr:MAG TPA: KGK domain [Caudoviricetes sp.]DAW78045.1 MAG TPA: KGK domain [Caudoviricetes sp.]